MRDKRFLLSSAAVWLVTVLGALGARSALITAPVPFTELAGWLFLACTPGAIVLIIIRGMAAPSVAQVLYETEHPVTPSPASPDTRDTRR
jgi:hypothetical protein